MSVNRLCIVFAFAGVFSLGSVAGQAAEQIPPDVVQRLEKLEHDQNELKQQLKAKDTRIQNLEQKLQQNPASPPSVTVDNAAKSSPLSTFTDSRAPEYYGNFIPGKGFRVANTEAGVLDFSAYTYLRYLNQQGLEDHYTDSFGTTRELDQRNDLQLQKMILYFKGWIYDPDFRYVMYTWTSNTSQGDGAQVVVAGYLGYHFTDALNVSGGIAGLPSTRSMEGQWPNLLKVDYRTIADEYFRGSYTTGIFANGILAEGLQYKVMVGNNLSQLGVSGTQMDDSFDTVAGAIWWMPTTGEFGPGQGFGDYEFHDQLATRIGLHFTHSTEEKQSQPGTEDPENSQIRLSDGTAIFGVDVFGAGTQITQARYQMATLDAGMKFQGFALEAEYFWRWVDQFKFVGALPFDDLYDHGYQLQVSMMLIPKSVQLYVSGSRISGEYGDPSDVALGVNWYPLRDNRKLRFNAELLQLDDSPVGYSSVPFAVGGDGLVLVSHLELSI